MRFSRKAITSSHRHILKGTHSIRFHYFWICFTLVTGYAVHSIAQDSNPLQGTVKGGFKTTVSDGDKVSVVFRGDEIVDNRITGLSIQFNEDTEEAKPKFYAESPSCERSSGTDDITSTDSIKFWTADNRLIIEGIGWAWMKSQSLLIISNKVSTTIRKDYIEASPLSPKPKATSGGQGIVNIHSDRFTFNRNTSQATFSNNVTAEDPDRLAMSCNQLRINLGEGSEELKEVIAEGSVRLKLLDPKLEVEAQSGRAIYSFGTENEGTLELLDAPTWSATSYKGGGDRIVVSDTEAKGNFMVLGNAFATLDPANIRNQTLNDENTKTSLIEITSDQYNFDGDTVRFEGFVKASQQQNWTLQCDTLTAGVNQESGQVREIDAGGNVRLTQVRQGKTMQSSADQALYRPLQDTTESIVLTGSAMVDTGEYLARGQMIELVQSGEQQTINVTGLATLEMPVTTVISIGILDLPENNNTKENSDKPSKLRVTADHYQFADQKAVFENNVKVYFADSTMGCQRMDVKFTPGRTGIESLEATGNILFSGEEGRMTCQKVIGYFSQDTHQMERLVATESVRLTHPKGKARGDKATFYPQTATVHLTGDPQVVAQVPSSKGGRPNYFHAEGGTLYWNQARSRFSGKGMTVKTIENPDLW